MPFTVEADVYLDLLLFMPPRPWPAQSREIEGDVAAFLAALPREDAERCWRHWYRLHVNGAEPVVLRADEPEVDPELARRWERTFRAAKRFAYWQMAKMDTDRSATPLVDLWVGFQEKGSEERFRGNLGWWPRDRPGLARYR